MTIIRDVDFATKYMCSEIASYKAYGVVCLGIIFFIIGISLYVAIRDVVIHSKKNCYVVLGRVSHIECSLAYHSKLDLYKYGSRSVNVDRVPNFSKEIPIDKPAAGTIWCKTVYSYNYNGEDRIFVERNSKTYKNFKRDVFYRNAPVEIRIVKKTNEVYAPAAKNKVSYILLMVLYLILEVALTVGIILLIRMDV